MRPFSIAVLALLSGFVNAQTQCVDGIKFFIPRGTGEPEGPGAVGRLGEAVQALIPGSNIEAINYPASLIDPMYFYSVVNGTLALREAIVSYAEACPGGKMVITGASQVSAELNKIGDGYKLLR
jgi:acetylxylan esterase